MERLTDRVWYAPGGVNIGVVLAGDDGAILIDSGLNDTSVRKVLRALSERGRIVRAIVTTHGHADHFGGNAFVVKRTGARVYAPAWDDAVLRHPLMQPASLFAGADPPQALRTGFLLAQPSPVDTVVDPGPCTIEGVELQLVRLAGHSPNQLGVLVDGVFFCADVVLPDRVIDRYRMPYLYSVTDHLTALDRARTVPHTVTVPGHGPLLESIDLLVAMNRALVERVAEIVLDLCAEPSTPEALLAGVMHALGAPDVDAAGYFLLHPTIFAYLSHLERARELTHEIAGGYARWRRR